MGCSILQAGLVIYPLHSKIDAAIAPLEKPWRASPKLDRVLKLPETMP